MSKNQKTKVNGASPAIQSESQGNEHAKVTGTWFFDTEQEYAYETLDGDAKSPTTSGDAKIQVAWVETPDFDLRRRADIRKHVTEQVRAFHRYLSTSSNPIMQQLTQDIGGQAEWEQLIEALVEERVKKGMLWKDPKAQQALIEEKTLYGKAAQVDEALFGTLNAESTAIGLISVLMDPKIKNTPGITAAKALIWVISFGFATYGVWPDMTGINPEEQAIDLIRPPNTEKKSDKGKTIYFPFKFSKFTTAREAEWLRHALAVEKKHSEDKITPWKKGLGLVACEAGATAAFSWITSRYLAEYIGDEWYYQSAVGFSLGSTFTALVASGTMTRLLNAVFPTINKAFFTVCNFVGGVAQYIPIALFYDYQIDWFKGNPDSYSRYLKGVMGLAFYSALYLYAIRTSKRPVYKKIATSIAWFILCATIVVENPSMELKWAFSLAWTTLFFKDAGMSYYEFLSGEASEKWGKLFFTMQNKLAVLFKVNFWLGFENLVQLAAISTIRGGTFSGLVAEYLGIGYGLTDLGVMDKPSKFGMLTAATTSTAVTRLPGVSATDSFEVTDNLGRTHLVPTLELYEFPVEDGIPAINHPKAQPTVGDKLYQGRDSTLYGFLIAFGLSMIASNKNDNSSTPIIVGIVSFLVIAISNYLGLIQDKRIKGAEKLVKAYCAPTEDEKAQARAAKIQALEELREQESSNGAEAEEKEAKDAKQELTPAQIVAKEEADEKEKADRNHRLEKAGYKLAMSTLIANNVPRLLSAAFFIASAGLFPEAEAFGLDNFKTVWIASLCVGLAARIPDARMLREAGAKSSVNSMAETEDELLEARKNPPQGCLKKAGLVWPRIKYWLYAGQLPEATPASAPVEMKTMGSVNGSAPVARTESKQEMKQQQNGPHASATHSHSSGPSEGRKKKTPPGTKSRLLTINTRNSANSYQALNSEGESPSPT